MLEVRAAQHPGVDTPQARNSAVLHLSRPCPTFDRGGRIANVDELDDIR